MKDNQPNTNLQTAPMTKRFGAFGIDFVLAILMGVILYLTWGTHGLYRAMGSDAIYQEAMAFYDHSGLYSISTVDGRYSTDGAVKRYAPIATAENGQADHGYALYLNDLWHFYTVFLPTEPNIDEVNGVAPAEYYTVSYFQTKIMGLPSDSSAFDINDETTYSSVDGFFRYALNDEGTAVDVTKKPVLKSAAQTLVDAKDTATLTRLNDAFFASSNTGLTYNAAVNLSEQTYLVGLGTSYSKTIWARNAVVVAIPVFIFFLLLPLVLPNGASLGKLIMRLGVVKKDGCRIGFKERILRPWVLVITVGAFMAFPQSLMIIAIGVLFALLAVNFIIAGRDKSGNLRSLQDRLAGTVVISLKGAKIYANPDEIQRGEAIDAVDVAPMEQSAPADDYLDVDSVEKDKEEANR